MKCCMSLVLSAWLALCCLAQAGENILRDGGFEQFLDKPDEQGNPFKVWGGWKWEGNCKRVADTRIKHSGRASAEIMSYGACKVALIQTFKTEAGSYMLSGYVRAINLKPGLYGRGLVVSFEPQGKEIMLDLPAGTYGWRRFEITQPFGEAYEKNSLYIYLFGSGKIWLDDLKLEKLEGTGPKHGLVMGRAEETLKGFTGEGGLKCPSCGLMVDPKADACGVCGEPTTGVADYARANATYRKVAELIGKARQQGADVLYWQAAAIAMRVGLNERWNSFPEERLDTLEYVDRRGKELIREIDDVLAGKTQPRQVPPKPDFTKMKLQGRDFCEGDQPRFIFSVHTGPVQEAEPFFSHHTAWVSTCMAPGASRFDYKQQPIWEAFNRYPDTHRVWGGGWCGHIIADKWSGGVSGANIVICLESPHTREACAKFYQKTLPGQMKSKTRLVSLLDYEYFYVCYCDATRDMFRKWLKDKFGTIDRLNAAWGTTHKDFGDVALPDYRRGREPNDAKRYDWLEFNIWRFTEFMKWAKAQQRKLDPDVPMATCAPHYNFTTQWGESGSDVESMANAVNDFCINESPPSTKYVDFLRSISDNKKAIVEVEGSEYRNTMASFLHGLSALSLYWGWADKPGDGGALLYGRGTRPPLCTVAEAERFLRTALDVRRLEKEILAFQDISAPVAVLYSKASMLQVPAGTGDKTPYLLELDHCYDALLESGVPVDFVTTKQVLEGKLSQYRVLVIPAATSEHASVVEKVMAFARAGGQVVLVPNSWFFDQYNRKQEYLSLLGISVVSMRAPRIRAGAAKTGVQRDISGEETEAPFLMGLTVDSVVTDVPRARIKTTGVGLFADGEMTLEGAGVRHITKVEGQGTVLARFEEGQPAIVEIPAGQGAIYYLAIPLVRRSMVALMDRLLAKAGVQREVRFLSPEGKHVPGLEYRAIKAQSSWLAYVNNLDRRQARQVKLTSEIKFRGIRNLTLERDLPLSFLVPAGETFILRLEE
jgi:hypothetical protein